MISYRRPVVIATELKMRRTQFQGCFLLVEGQDDRYFMQSFTSPALCKIVVVEGKKNVCDTIDILNAENFQGVLGLVDADFDRVMGSSNTRSNLFMYDAHNLETMLIYSSALERVLLEFGSKDKIDRFDQNVREALIAMALPLGYLRLHSLQSRLDLTFAGLKYHTWVELASFESCVSKLIREVQNRSHRYDLSVDQVRSIIDALGNAGHHSAEICTGVDLIEILSIGLRRMLGSNKALDVNGEILKRDLRLAYSEQEFLVSNLGQSIQEWELNMRGQFQVFK